MTETCLSFDLFEAIGVWFVSETNSCMWLQLWDASDSCHNNDPNPLCPSLKKHCDGTAGGRNPSTRSQDNKKTSEYRHVWDETEPWLCSLLVHGSRYIYSWAKAFVSHYSPLTLTGGLLTSGLVERLVSTMAAVTLSISTSSSDRLTKQNIKGWHLQWASFVSANRMDKFTDNWKKEIKLFWLMILHQWLLLLELNGVIEVKWCHASWFLHQNL